MTAATSPTSRYTRARPCPICGGWESMPRGQGTRCDGYLFGEGAYCARRTDGKRHPTASLHWHRLRDAAVPPGRASAPAPRARIVATYDYRDENGTLVYQVVRKEPKAFLQRRPDGRGGWTWGLGDTRPCPYRLPELIAAAGAGDAIYVTEGEKDADAIHKAGAVATTSPMGAGKWRDEYAQHFVGAADVRIIADRDEPGRRHAAQVAASLRRVGIVPRVFEAAEGKDAADHLAAGLSLEELREIALDEPGAAIGAGEDAWPEPRPLPPKTPAAPAMPEDLLPEALRPWIVDAAERASLPLEYLAVPAVIALSSLVGRRLGIFPKRHDTGFLVVANLWGCIIGRPGLMKTAAVREALSPMQPLIARARAQYEESAASMEFEKVRLELEIKTRMGKKGDRGDPREIAELKRELRECFAVERRYLTHDSTVEKLGVILNENPRGVLVVRDELAGWLYTLEKPGREGERQFYLEAWNGAGSYTFDRIGRGTLHIPALCVSILGGIQPARLQPFLEEALESRPGADGLIQRFQLIAWPDEAPAWRNHDRQPDARERERVQRIFEAIDGLDVRAIIGEPPGGTIGLDVIPAIHFAADGQDLFDTWRDDLERQLRSPELKTTPAFEGHLSKFRSLMPSLALIFALVDAAEEGFVSFGSGVSLDATRRAAVWCEYLEAHGRKLYAVELNPAALAAHELARCIREKLFTDGMTLRDIQRAQWRGLTREGAVRDGIDLLERLGWLRQERREPGLEGGRPPSSVIFLNPRLGEGRG